MRRLRVPLLLVALLCCSVPAQAAFACAKAGEGTGGFASSTTVAASVSGVSAGDLLSAFVKNEEGTTTISVAGNGTSTFSVGSKVPYGSGDAQAQFHYLLSAPSGVTTVTATFGAARNFRSIIVVRCSYSGTASFDTEPAGGGATATGTSMSSGNMTTTGTDEVVICGYGEYSLAAISAQRFSGTNADAIYQVTADNFTEAWVRVLTGTTTGACTGTLDSSNEYALLGIAFKTTAGAATPTPRLMLLGVGGAE